MIKGAVVGAAIAAFNCKEELQRCLSSGAAQWDVTVVVDDASTDGTREMLRAEFPGVVVLEGSGNLWWTGGTNAAIRECLSRGCTHVLLVNPDLQFDPECVQELTLACAEAPARTVAAAVVLDAASPERVWWAGTAWSRIRWLPVFVTRYLFRSGTPTAALPTARYDTSEVHGRAVLLPASAFDEVGFYDGRALPHYGADVEYSFRLRAAGYRLVVCPRARVRLATRHSGMAFESYSLAARLRGAYCFLTQRKHGEALRVWWTVLRRHAPRYAFLPSFAFIISLNLYRRVVPRRGDTHGRGDVGC